MSEVSREASDLGAELRRVFDAQQAQRWHLAQSTAEERIARLVRLREAIGARREELQRAIHEDFRKSPAETDLTEVFPTIAEINHTVRHLKQWMAPRRVRTSLALLGARSEVRYEPKGRVLILSPWNYPFGLLVNPMVAAIAAGNCVIAKPSSKVPATARFLKSFITGLFDEGEVALFEGTSAVADALLELPFDHVFFTGSPRVGKSVMAAAAKHLASVTMELGGKSPVVVDRTADPRLVAERVLWGKYINAGQTCIAPDYMLLHESLRDRFLEEAKRVLDHRFGATEEARKASPDFCRAVSDAHLQGLQRVLDDSVAAGATVAIGGVVDATQRYLSPTILMDVREDSPIMQEEIFGPILPVITYRSLDEVFRVIRAREKPLALYVFGTDEGTIQCILANTTAGGTCVNSVVVHVANPNLPFGGVGQSGLGSYHGVHGFRNLSHERAVLRQGRFDSLKYFYPPYTDAVRKRIRLALKHLG
jgi:aldehyde dehydrogenase (NAD+)